MEEYARTTTRRHAAILVGILLLTAGVRLYHVGAPLVDQMFVKQVFVANKARAIAGPPFDLLCNRFDFLDDQGERMRLVEEAPLYTGLVGLGYRLVGEHEWLGRVASILASLIAVLAFADLMRREIGRRAALAGALCLAMCPLFVFYGRAVLPDPAMLAGMMSAACCYRRYLDGEGRGWWLLALVAGASGALFKYYGLMVLLPLADMAWRQGGWRACIRPSSLVLAAGMALPVGLWTLGVFERGPNPSQGGVYFLFQAPELLGRRFLYERLVERFFWKDCGPVVSLLVAVGVWAAATRRLVSRPLWAWTAMGLGFYFLLAPKLERHDYYELMMLPAAAAWAGLGWKAVADGGLRWRAWAGTAALAAVVVVQSPWVMPAKFRLEKGHLVLAERLRHYCPPGGRVVVLGPEWSHSVVHYSGREGWVFAEDELPPDWPERLARCHSQGADYVAVYLNPLASPAMRESYRLLTDSLPVVEHQAGPWARKGEAEFFILDLRGVGDGAVRASVPELD